MRRVAPKSIIPSLVALAVIATTAVPARAGDDIDPKAAAKAMKLVEGNRKLIAFFAHSTCRFDEMTYAKAEKTRGGFKLTYNLNYTAVRGHVQAFYSNQAFYFDGGGDFTSVASAGYNSSVGPFVASDLAIATLKNEIKKNPRLKDNTVLMELIDKADARAILGFLLSGQ